jgi:hypothetical protein
MMYEGGLKDLCCEDVMFAWLTWQDDNGYSRENPLDGVPVQHRRTEECHDIRGEASQKCAPEGRNCDAYEPDEARLGEEFIPW